MTVAAHFVTSERLLAVAIDLDGLVPVPLRNAASAVDDLAVLALAGINSHTDANNASKSLDDAFSLNGVSGDLIFK